jgi:heptosyltransferase II
MKILVILASGIGNSIMFSPVLSALRKKYPDARIDAFAYKSLFAEPFKGSELINHVYYYEKGYSGIKTLLRLRRNKYDISITAFPSNKWHFNLFTFLVGAKKKLTHSYNFGKLRTLSFLQNHKTPAEENLHDVEQNLNLLKLLNMHVPKEKQLFFHTGEENEKWADDFIKKNNLEKKHLIGVHPGSGPLDYKRAPLEKFIELIKKQAKENSMILIFGGDEEEKIKKELQARIKNSIFVSSNLKNTASLIRRCNLFITNDTGLMHIASTSKNTKVIAIFNGTNPIRTSPYTKNSEIITLRDNQLKYPFYSTVARGR